jgi:mannose-6-phosphate isomerase-like protein (cupin superfamily)
MKNVQDYIDSGILELYVLGVTNEEENREIAKMALSYLEVREEIENISTALEEYANQNALTPDPTIKPFLFASIDYTQRLKNGEQASFPPVLNENSRISDYNLWIDRNDIKLPENFKDFHAQIIGYTPEMTTAIIWIKDMAPQEMHKHEFEKFLILEGTCDITIEDKIHSLKAGDYLSIPLYKNHDVKITSLIPCKAILQRIAA